jgi:hypothetical protein
MNDEPIEEAVIEDESSDEESFLKRNWLLIVGLGLVFLGYAIRWYRKQ